MPDPQSQVDMFEDDSLQAILGNMLIVEEPEEEETPPIEKEEKKED